MRKILLTLMSFMLFAVMADAQGCFSVNALKADKGILQKRQNLIKDDVKKPLKTRQRIQLADNEKIMGLYDTDEVAEYGVGLPGYPGNLRAAAIIPVSEDSKFNGGIIKAIRFALCYPVGASRVFVVTVTKDGGLGEEVVSQDVASTAKGWNMVELTTPYTIDASNISGYLVGFDYTQVNTNDGYSYDEACYPLSFVEVGKSILPTYIYGNLGQGIGWYNIGAESYGNLSVQCIVEKDGYPQYDLVMDNVDVSPFVKKGSKLQFGNTVWSDGLSVPSSFTVGIGIDGNEVATKDYNAPDFTEGVYVSGLVDINTDMTTGEHTLSMYIKTINGTVPADATSDDSSSSEFNVYSESMPRQKQLVEHFTSQYCTYCPLGISVLEGLVEKRDDIAWVSIHGNMSSGTDQYTISAGNNIAGFQTQGFPSASFNRTLIPGQSNLAIGIGWNASMKDQAVTYISNLIDYTNEIPALASVDINIAYDDATRNLDITVSGQTLDEFATFVGSDAALTVYLTEDGLVARQLNQGSWIASFTHDNVLRKVVTDTYGDAMNMSGNTYENTYSVTLDDSWNKDNMHVVAFVSRMVKTANLYDKLWVNNTEIVAVKDAATGIATVTGNGVPVKEVARYSADGALLSAPVKGMNIVRLSDGSIRKVVVE